MSDNQLGEKIKSMREEAGLGLRDLAAKANVSPSMLSQIENGSANPSINTLKNIAVVLNLPLYRFFQEDTDPSGLIVHKDSRKMIGFAGHEVQYELLTPDVSGQIEFCRMTIPPNKASAGMPEGHVGEEVAYVVSGQISILLEDTCVPLTAGDSLRIPPMTQHRWINSTAEDAVIIFAVSPLSF